MPSVQHTAESTSKSSLLSARGTRAQSRKSPAADTTSGVDAPQAPTFDEALQSATKAKLQKPDAQPAPKPQPTAEKATPKTKRRTDKPEKTSTDDHSEPSELDARAASNEPAEPQPSADACADETATSVAQEPSDTEDATNAIDPIEATITVITPIHTSATPEPTQTTQTTITPQAAATATNQPPTHGDQQPPAPISKVRTAELTPQPAEAPAQSTPTPTPDASAPKQQPTADLNPLPQETPPTKKPDVPNPAIAQSQNPETPTPEASQPTPSLPTPKLQAPTAKPTAHSSAPTATAEKASEPKPLAAPLPAPALAEIPSTVTATFSPAIPRQDDPAPASNASTPITAQPTPHPQQPATAGAETARPAQETPAPDPQQTFDQVVLGLRGKFDPRAGKAEIRLDPPNLGTVRVSMSLENGSLSANFQSSSDLVRGLLKEHMDQLKSVLESRGVAVDRLAVEAPRDAVTSAPSAQQQNSSGNAAHDGRSAGQHQQDPRSRNGRPGDGTFASLFKKSAAQPPVDLVA